MVTYIRVNTSRLYVAPQYANDIREARIGFLLQATVLPTPSIDPIAMLGKGVFCLFPTFSADVALEFPASAADAIDMDGGTNPRLALFTIDGSLRKTQIIDGGPDGILTSDVSIELGERNTSTPTGNGHWRSTFCAGGKMVGVGDSLQFEFAPTATDLGLLLDRDDTLAPLPDGHRHYELVLTGTERGLFRFPIMVDENLAGVLGLGMRYFQLQEPSDDRAQVLSLPYPIYELGSTEQFSLAIDFASPFEWTQVDGGVRPRSMLYPPKKGLRSTWNEVHGHVIAMAPASMDKNTGFRLSRSPTALATDGSGDLLGVGHYLTPHGKFKLGREDANAHPLRLSFGLSNMESLSVDHAGGDCLNFDLGHSLVGIDAALDLVDVHCRTAWGTFIPGTAPKNSKPLAVDPEGMPGYMNSPSQGMPFQASCFNAPGGAFPIVPLLGLATSVATDATARARIDLERNVIARGRRENLVDANNLVSSISTGALMAAARTPQGYSAERPGGTGTWAKITFGKTAKSPEDTNAIEFGFIATNDASRFDLANVLAGNRLFLVTRPSQLAARGFDKGVLSTLFMGGWEASLGPDAFIIIKHDDRPIIQLIDDLANWTERAKFLPDLSDANAVRAAIQATMTDTQELYAPLRRRLSDPSWNGILVLRSKLLKGGLPSQIGALAANLPELNIHHVGMDISVIDGRIGAGKPWPTAMFGIIDYDGSEAEFSKNDFLWMRVTRLVLRVENDSIDRFECTVEIRLRQLFDIPTAEPDKTLVLLGKYESRVDAGGHRHESYRFVAEDVGGGPIFEHKFGDPSVVTSAQLNRFELLTVIENTIPSGRFLVDGDISFREISELDLLGIDQLEFAGFAFNFSISPFNVTFTYPSIRFNLDGFNKGAIRRRTESFLSKFPLKLRGLRFGDLDLAQLGYFDFGPVVLPPKFDPSPKFRFGFDFDLDLGSLGALAKNLDRFKLQIIVGWKPEGDGQDLKNKLAFGFRLDLGEGAGGIDLGLEGILRVKAERFNIKKVKLPAPANGDVIVLSAYKCVLDILGQRLPTQDDQLFSLYIFGDIGHGLFERPGWYACFHDASPTDPVKLDMVAMGQRVNVRFDEVNTAKDCVEWLGKQETFGPDDEKKFVDFAGAAGSVVQYDPSRDWFLATSGTFFEVAHIALLLRDPDLYGAYIGILGQDTKPLFSLDLLYQKLADGVGRYVVEILLPPEFRTFDAGAVSITIGVIRAEMYTDGGFLVDLGMPQHVDYSRSFVVQGGPFIGKGGFYIGRTPREAAPLMTGLNVGSVFRMGMAMRIGLGREFEKGPVRVGLSVSVFGRIDGAIARRTDIDGYAVALQGEVGIIAELEGSVDLRLIRARLFIRLWIAAGMVLVTGKPVLLYCEAGVDVSLEFCIGRIRIFGHTIAIYIHLSYRTTLRFEWELPVRVPSLMVIDPPKIELSTLPPWTLPDFSRLGVAVSPIQLRLGFDGVRVLQAGTPQGRAVPSIFWIVGDGLNTGRAPFAEMGRSLVAWAALRCVPDAATADSILLAKTEQAAGDVTIGSLQKVLGTFNEIEPTLLQQVLVHLFIGSNLDIVKDGSSGDAYSFPVPPGLVLDIAGTKVDFSSIGELTDTEADQLVEHLNAQFAEISKRPPPLMSAAGAQKRPLAQRLFQDWCQLLALSTLDALDEAFVAAGDASKVVKLGNLWPAVKWEGVAGRVGRLFHSGARVPNGSGGFEPLLSKAGMFVDIPAAKKLAVRISGTGESAWLAAGPGSLDLDGSAIARLAIPAPQIQSKIVEAPAIRLVARGFNMPEFGRVFDQDGKVKALICSLGTDLQRQLALSINRTFPSDLVFSARKRQSGGQGPIVEIPLSKTSTRGLVFDMSIEQIPAPAGLGAVPNCFQIAGASEAERIGLDALLKGAEAEVEARLAGSHLTIAWKSSESNSNGHGSFTFANAPPEALIVVRSTVSFERRPFEKNFNALVVEPEDIYRATMKDSDRLAALSLLQRAAVVNCGGTYLIVPPAIGTLLDVQFKGTKRVNLTFILEYASTAPVMSDAVNSILVTVPEDIAILDDSPIGNIVSAKLSPSADLEALATTMAGMVETVALRPPGTELLRIWRKAPSDLAVTAPIDDQVKTHIETQFDMLEFQIEDDTGKVLLAFDESLPLASERAVPTSGPDQIKAWLQSEVSDAGFKPEDYRYDLILPLARLTAQATRGDGIYVGVGRKFVVKGAWRDYYGNRLGAGEMKQSFQLLYHDPIAAIDAWPGVVARFSPGGAGSKSLSLILTADASGNSPAVALGLLKVIEQLNGPGVTIELESSLGVLKKIAFPTAKLIQFLGEVKDHLADGFAAPPPFQHQAIVATMKDAPFLPIDMRVVIARDHALVAPSSLAQVGRVACAISNHVPQQESEDVAQVFSNSFVDAFSSPGKAVEWWAAIGDTDMGEATWWAVNANLIPNKGSNMPCGLAPPPLALAPLSTVEANVKVVQPAAGGNFAGNTFAQSEERQVEVRAHDRDSDELMQLFLSRIDAFLSPMNAPVTAQAAGPVGGTSPFEIVARAKATLLGRDSADRSLLLQFLQGVRDSDIPDSDTLLEAKRIMREACAAEIQRYHTVGGVLVQPLDSKVKAGWFSGEPRPKIYGRLTFGGESANAPGFRAVVRGIELREGKMELGIAVLPDTDTAFVNLSKQGPVEYECTHIERLLEQPVIPGRLAPSRWLTLIPIQSGVRARLPSIQLAAAGQELIVPTPVRRIPLAPSLSNPSLSPYEGDPVTTYGQKVAAARRWTFGFELGAQLAPGDDFCGRLVYNGSLSDAPVQTASPAKPLFEQLFPQLVAFEARIASYWDAIAQEAGRRAAGGADIVAETRFDNACNRFAEAIGDVLVSMAVSAPLQTPTDLLEDRFIISDDAKGTHRITTIVFKDHIASGDPDRPPEAGEGRPGLYMRQLIGDKAHDPVNTQPEWDKGIFVFDSPELPLRRRQVEIRRLDALRLQSAWVAGSVRRNARIHGESVRARFIYRTSEIYLQQVSVPNLVRRQSILFSELATETLASRLSKALIPVFRGQLKPTPAQVRFDFESERMVELLTQIAGGEQSDFLPEPDAKVQFTDITIGAGGSISIDQLAIAAAEVLLARFAIDPPAKTGRIVVGVLIKTAGAGPAHPLLRLTRLVVPIANLTDL